jgi:hypothetical protein
MHSSPHVRPSNFQTVFFRSAQLLQTKLPSPLASKVFVHLGFQETNLCWTESNTRTERGFELYVHVAIFARL